MLVLVSVLLAAGLAVVRGQYVSMTRYGICDALSHEQKREATRRRIELAHGPNVCAVEEVMGSGRRYHSECLSLASNTVCEKPTFTRYQCCNGFEMTSADAFGCEKAHSITNLLSTAVHLYLTNFEKFTRRSKTNRLLMSDSDVLTVFAPQNRAFEGLAKIKRRSLASKKNSLLQYHMSRGRLPVAELLNNMQITTLYQNNATLRVNRYANGIVTLNCVRIIYPDQLAANGMLHVMEGVIPTVPQKKSSIADILVADNRLVDLSAALFATEMSTILGSVGPFTFFAPTDAAFDNVPEDIKNRMLADKDLLLRILLYHTVNDTICSAAMMEPGKLRSLEGQTVELSCDLSDAMTINGVSVIEADIVASNGVIHIIDEMLIPNSARPLRLALSDLAVDEFSEYARLAGLDDILDGYERGNYTFFAPTDGAFSKLSGDQLTMVEDDPERVFRYHVIDSRVTTDHFVDDASQVTRSTRPSDRLILKVNQRSFGVNSANIISADNVAGASVVHVIDSVLLPPTWNIVDVLTRNTELRSFMGLLQDAGLDTLLQTDGPFTLFAPINAVVDELAISETNRTSFVKYHVLSGAVFTSSLRTGLQYDFVTLSGDTLTVAQQQDGDPLLVDKQAKVIRGDMAATNGVVHVIGSVLRAKYLAQTGSQI